MVHIGSGMEGNKDSLARMRSGNNQFFELGCRGIVDPSTGEIQPRVRQQRTALQMKQADERNKQELDKILQEKVQKLKERELKLKNSH